MPKATFFARAGTGSGKKQAVAKHESYTALQAVA